MIGNLYPYFTAPNEGCFYWGWIIDVDIQLTLLIPIFVCAYLKSKVIGHVTLAIFMILATIIGSWTVYEYDIKAGILASQNWFLFAYVLEKPWSHIGSTCVGVYFAQLYMQLL
jgi:hypothetical protein